MLPSLFIAHGSPMLAIENNEYTRFLSQLGKTLPRPKAVVLFSAHWENPTQLISNVEEFTTIYDFGGFDPQLNSIKYPAKGNNQITEEIKNLFISNQIPFEVDNDRGLDHGAWVVLRKLYPNADIPVVSMSVNPNITPEEQYKIGQSLTALRANDVLVIGSGGTVHNLRVLNWADNGQVDPWAEEFDNWLSSHLSAWDTESLFKYDGLAPFAEYAVPQLGREHFIPLFYAMGAADDAQKATLLHRSYRYGSLSHSVWLFG